MGQIGSAMTNPTTFEAQPKDFSGSDWAARLMGGGLKGLGQGLQRQQPQPQGGGAVPIPMAPQPQVNLPQSPMINDNLRMKNPYFFGY